MHPTLGTLSSCIEGCILPSFCSATITSNIPVALRPPCCFGTKLCTAVANGMTCFRSDRLAQQDNRAMLSGRVRSPAHDCRGQPVRTLTNYITGYCSADMHRQCPSSCGAAHTECGGGHATCPNSVHLVAVQYVCITLMLLCSKIKA